MTIQVTKLRWMSLLGSSISGLHPAGCHAGAPLGLAHGQSDPRLQRRREEGESQARNAQQPVDGDGHGGDGSKGLGMFFIVKFSHPLLRKNGLCLEMECTEKRIYKVMGSMMIDDKPQHFRRLLNFWTKPTDDWDD